MSKNIASIMYSYIVFSQPSHTDSNILNSFTCPYNNNIIGLCIPHL